MFRIAYATGSNTDTRGKRKSAFQGNKPVEGTVKKPTTKFRGNQRPAVTVPTANTQTYRTK